MRQRVMVFDPDTGTMKAAWQDRGPAYARVAGTRGELAVGVSAATLELMRERRKRESK